MTRSRVLQLLIALLLGGQCSLASSATCYVGVDGNDKNPGTHEAPWATLRHAGQQAKPGDCIKVKAGVYRQTSVITACRGTAAQPIVFEACGGTVTLDGSEPIGPWRAESGACYSTPVGNKPIYLVWAGDRLLLGPQYREPFDKFAKPTKETLRRGQCLLEDGRLYVRLFDSGDPNRVTVRASVGHCVLLQATEHTLWRGIGTTWGLNGYKLEAGSAHNTIADAELHHHGQGILEVTKPGAVCQDNTFQGLEIHHVGLTKFEHGIYTNGVRTRILHCRFHHISGAGIHAYPEPFQGQYDGNVITDPLPTYYAEHFIRERPTEPTGYYTAFVCWGRGEHRVTNNLIAGPFGNGISVRSSRNRLVNNTIVLGQGTGIWLASKHAANSLLNNIIQTAGLYLAEALPTELDYNGYWGGKGWACGDRQASTLADLRKLGQEAHGVLADPRFADPAQGNYRLTPASPMRRAGDPTVAPPADLLGTRRVQGADADLGAYQQ